MAGQGSILRPSQDADLGNPGAISPDCRGTARTDALATVPYERGMDCYRSWSAMGRTESSEAVLIRQYTTKSGKRGHYGNIVPTFPLSGTMCDSAPIVKRTKHEYNSRPSGRSGRCFSGYKYPREPYFFQMQGTGPLRCALDGRPAACRPWLLRQADS